MVLRIVSINAKYRSWLWVAVRKCLFIAVLPLIYLACTNHRPKYVIGVSQCSEDIWRNKLNDELMLMFRLENRVLKPTEEVRVDCVLVWGLYIEVRLFES